MQSLPITRTTATARLPMRGTAEAAGLDLYADEALTITPGAYATISTGLCMAIPTGQVGLIRPRSGMAVKHGIDVLAGVIDADYRGVVKVALINHGQANFPIECGDKIAQLLIQPITPVTPTEVEQLDATGRGAGGFGHTGR